MRAAMQLVQWVLLTSIVGLVSCDRGQEAKIGNAAGEAKPKPKVAVIATRLKSIQPSFQVPAVTMATQTARVHPEVNALVKAIHFTPGALVNEGDLMVELEEANISAVLSAAEASLSAAEATAQQARVSFERAEKLKPDGYISGRDYDQIQANFVSAQAAVQQAKAQLERAQLDLARTKIYAPFDGKVSESFHAVGDNVGPNSPEPLFELVALNPIYAVGDVEQRRYETFILKRMELEEQGADIPELEVGLRLPSGNEYPLRGRFENWDHSAAAQSGTIKGRVIFENPDNLLLPGQNVTLFGRLMASIERIMIPQKAVSQDQQGHYVFTVDDQGEVARVNVEMSIRDGPDWAVASGLSEGQRVIVEGLQKVSPGIAVEAVPYQADE